MKTNVENRLAVQSYCKKIAKNRLLVQAAGGNVSWKSESILWIKASGTWLADAETKDIFTPVDRDELDAALARGDFSITPQPMHGYSLRPSIETLLHAIMPYQFVVHLHPVEAVAKLIRSNCKDEIQALINNVFLWELIDYQKPGADLAKAVHAKLSFNPQLQAIFLKNHGVILGADSLEEIDIFLKIISQKLGSNPYQDIGKNSVATIQRHSKFSLIDTDYSWCVEPELQSLAINPILYVQLQSNWAICPDHVVFLGAKATCLEPTQVSAFLTRTTTSSPFIFINGVGVLKRSVTTPAQTAQLIFYFDVLVRQNLATSLACLKSDDVAALLNWDAEKYRLKQSESTSSY
jgi:rhamnose utilization protein RhaD (predicted bifunctional aldolase and dehydrogenase)